MADEALRELLEEWRRSLKAREDMLLVEGMDVDDPVTGYRGDPDYYRRNNVIAGDMRARVNALESALSELARLRAEREWKPIAELAELKPALVGLEGEYPTMAWRTKDGRWAVSEFDALQWTPTHYMTLPDEPPVQSHEEKPG